MGNKAQGLMEAIRLHAGEGAWQALTAVHGVPGEKASVREQAEYVNAVITDLVGAEGEAVAERALKACGYQCISQSIIDEALALHERSNGIGEFLGLLNEHHLGGGGLRLEDGRVIGVYGHCYCGLPKAIEGMTPVYCHCSAGWFESLFKAVYGDSVKVGKLRTILDGADECVFEIRLG